MYENNENPPIVKLSRSINCWVVRCESGEYYQHFKDNSLIAIGHIDSLEYNDVNQFMVDPETAEFKIIQILTKRQFPKNVAKRKARSDINQALKFI